MSLKKRFLSTWQTEKSHPDQEKITKESEFLTHLQARRHLNAGTKARLKSISKEPNIPGITKGTRQFFRIKALIYLFKHDKGGQITKFLIKKPLLYFTRYIRELLFSLVRGKSYFRDGDFFYYGIKNTDSWCQRALCNNTLLVLGFSYCHKPLECPSGRFTDRCMNDPHNEVCQSCFISELREVKKFLPDVHLITIPTVHAIGSTLLEIQDKYPKKKILFLITACEMTLEMFGEFGALAGARGIGVRLGGRICNTMRAFELSEEGIKPGLTHILPETQVRMLALLSSLIEKKQAC